MPLHSETAICKAVARPSMPTTDRLGQFWKAEVGDFSRAPKFQHSLGAASIESREKTLLRPRPSGGGTQVCQLRFEPGARGLTPALTAGIRTISLTES
jgi:hypothetical protein